MTSGDWLDHAACTTSDTDLFYVMHARGTVDPYKARAALNVCRPCPVIDQCLKWALSPEVDDRWAVLGGTLPTQRAKMRRQMRRTT